MATSFTFPATYFSGSDKLFVEAKPPSIGAWEIRGPGIPAHTQVSLISPTEGGYNIEINQLTTSEQEGALVTAENPVIFALEPEHGKAGDEIRISGIGFTEGPTVRWGSTEIESFICESANAVRFLAPPGHGTISVTIGDGEEFTTAADFIYDEVPDPERESVSRLNNAHWASSPWH